MSLDPKDFPGACVPHLLDTGRIVQANGETLNGVELCASCAESRRDVTTDATTGADANWDGRRFHKHARNCGLCRAVVSTTDGDPKKLCLAGKGLYIAAVKAQKAAAPAA